MKKLSGILAVIIIGILILSSLTGCNDEETTTPRLRVVASTSQITQIVERIGGDRIDVVNIIPPGQCPGHFDCSPADIQKLVDADIFLLHGWQGEVFTDDLITSADNNELTVVRLDVKVGENINWMAPPVQRAAVDKIIEILSQADATNSAEYQAAATEYKEIITGKEVEIREKLALIDPASINVICGQQQIGFLKWAGFNVVGFYGETDTWTPQTVQDLVDLGINENVALVIDNMQSGIDAGAGIAEDINATQVTLSNFPGGYEITDTWEETIDYNVELLIEALTG